MATPTPWTGLTPADQAIISAGVDMQIWTNPGPIDGFPDIDDAGNIPFQFPPRITSDGKASIWLETNQNTWEPLALFMGSESRKVTLETQYVVTAKGAKGWSVGNIAQVLRLYKSYFYMTMGSLNIKSMPLVRLRIYEYANDPDSQIYWRAKHVAITSDGALINDGGTILSLIHKVSMNLELITQVEDPTIPSGPLHAISVLPPIPKKEWY